MKTGTCRGDAQTWPPPSPAWEDFRIQYTKQVLWPRICDNFQVNINADILTDSKVPVNSSSWSGVSSTLCRDILTGRLRCVRSSGEGWVRHVITGLRPDRKCQLVFDWSSAGDVVKYLCLIWQYLLSLKLTLLTVVAGSLSIWYIPRGVCTTDCSGEGTEREAFMIYISLYIYSI
jgi:hypothetical protein